jgi:hypothetical protein
MHFKSNLSTFLKIQSCINFKSISHIKGQCLVVLGDIVFIVLAIAPKLRGFKPGQGR